MRNLLRTKSSKRGEDYHLQRMMENSQRRKDLTQIGFNFICGLPLQLQLKKNGNNSRALCFSKTTFKMPNVPSPYEKLSRGMIMGVVHYKW
jgi:hypothetical protein